MPTICSGCIAKKSSTFNRLTLVAAFLALLLTGCNAEITHDQLFTGKCGISTLPPPNVQAQINATLQKLPSFAAEADEIPWQARILVDGNFVCSGAIVNSKAITTSATCLDRALGKDAGGTLGLDRMRVIVGAAFDFRAGRYGESVFKVTRLLTHGNYIADPNKNINDLAYVYVDGSIGARIANRPSGASFRDQPSVRPVCVLDDGSNIDVGKPGHVAVVSFWIQPKVPTSGLGALDYGTCSTEEYKSTYVPLPYKAWVRIVPTEACMEYFPINRRLWPADHYICAEADPITINANICCSEGGAPLAQKFGDRWFLLGTFTRIAGCQYNPVGFDGTPPLLLFAATTGTQTKWMKLHEPDDPETTTYVATMKILAAGSSNTYAFNSIAILPLLFIAHVFNLS